MERRSFSALRSLAWATSWAATASSYSDWAVSLASLASAALVLAAGSLARVAVSRSWALTRSAEVSSRSSCASERSLSTWDFCFSGSGSAAA